MRFLASALCVASLATPLLAGVAKSSPCTPTTWAAQSTAPSGSATWPASPSSSCPSTENCLSSATASAMVQAFVSLLTDYSQDVAEALLAANFQDTSDSINFLEGAPLGSTTFPSKQAFEEGQSEQPAIPSFTVLNIDAITCEGVVAWRWLAELGQDEVKGINIFYATKTGEGNYGGWQISQNFSEFNSAAWVVDIGGTCAAPAPAPTK